MIDLKPLLKDPSQVTVLYHAGCQDGFTAALCLWYCLGDQAIYKPMRYDEKADPALWTGRNVIMVDYSMPRQELLAIKQEAVGLVVLDHHKTAEQDLQGLDFCWFSSNKSGAVLALSAVWHLLPTTVPLAQLTLLTRYVQDQDLWHWELADSRIVSAALLLWPRGDFGLWAHRLSEAGVDVLHQHWVTEGTVVLARDKILLDYLKTQARMRIFAGQDAIEINSPVLASELGEILNDRAPVVIIWHQRADGMYQYSLRTQRPEVDVSEMARVYGGGGHRAAAGFSSLIRV